MVLTKKRVETYKIELVCEECGIGTMLPSGMALMSSPPKYPHKCSECGHAITVEGATYPAFEFEEVEV